jgi:hypothetical protein
MLEGRCWRRDICLAGKFLAGGQMTGWRGDAGGEISGWRGNVWLAGECLAGGKMSGWKENL